MYNGIINIYKEKGYTSHDVVAKLRGIFRQKKIGHTGTLDPDAEGVLPVCLGQATKLCELLTDKQKHYECILLLGMETDTQDISGQILSTKEVDMTPEQISDIVKSFEGEQMQIPPMYSALKIGGQKLCDLARKGIEVERAARPVTFYDICVTEIELPRVKLSVECSRGTYIRTLCHDIGEKAGCGGCMEYLLRTRAGRFGIEESIRLCEVEEAVKEGRGESLLLPVDTFFEDLPVLPLLPAADKLLHNGNPFSCGETGREEKVSGTVRVYDSAGQFIGIYEYHEEKKRYQPVKLFIGG